MKINLRNVQIEKMASKGFGALFLYLVLLMHPKVVHCSEISEFIETFEQVESLYAQEILKHSIHITFESLDKKPNIAIQMVPSFKEGEYSLRFTDGFAKSVASEKKLRTIHSCHELGHIFARLTIDQERISPEGAADYFATSDCLKRIIGEAPQLLTDLNLKKLTEEKKNKIMAQVIKQYIKFNLKNWKREDVENQGKLGKPKWGRMDTNQVSTLLYSYPSLQCRLDSLIAGFNCKAEPVFKNESDAWIWKSCDVNFSEKNAQARKVNGNLPLCWFHESI